MNSATVKMRSPSFRKKESRVTTLIQRCPYNAPKGGHLFGGKERPGGFRPNNVLLRYGEVAERAISAQRTLRDFQILQQLVNQYRRPEDRLEESKDSHPERRRLLDKVNERTDERESVDTTGDTAVVHPVSLPSRVLFLRHGNYF